MWLPPSCPTLPVQRTHEPVFSQTCPSSVKQPEHCVEHPDKMPFILLWAWKTLAKRKKNEATHMNHSKLPFGSCYLCFGKTKLPLAEFNTRKSTTFSRNLQWTKISCFAWAPPIHRITAHAARNLTSTWTSVYTVLSPRRVGARPLTLVTFPAGLTLASLVDGETIARAVVVTQTRLTSHAVRLGRAYYEQENNKPGSFQIRLDSF